MMISERHKTNNLVTIFCCWLCLHVACPSNCLADEVFEVLPQTATTSDEVNVLATTAATAARLDPNNNNEWRPLGHGDPLQKDPTYDYSPPALERVRYWAENNVSNQDAARVKLPVDKTKSEVLLLGVAGERERERDRQRTAQLKATSQQAKYAAIRRSYYAPQQQQQQPQQQQHMPRTHLMPPPMMMKGMGMGMGMGLGGAHVEYRHSVMNSPSSSSYMSMNLGSSYSSAAAAPYASSHTSAHTSAHSSAHTSAHTSAHSSASKPLSSTHYYSSPASAAATSSWYSPQRLSYGDAHQQESMAHYSISRPNAIHPHVVGSKQLAATVAQRKPWLHELLQKELVMPTMKQRLKPTMPATKYLMGTTKPQPLTAQQPFSFPTYAPLTYAPVTFVPGPPTIEAPTTSSSHSSPHSQLYVTPTTLTPTINSGFRPMMMSTLDTTTSSTALPIYQPAVTATTPSTTTTSSSTTSTTSTTTAALSNSRLLIPTQSNLYKRPTVAPAPELTTDALFSHYKQPPKALLGPMYLIIEGHSKVKTYGQNELDPHSPKIVPVISKREPVVRLADPNEKRGTVETYQVKHLHTKTMPLTTTTTTTPATTTTSRTTTTTAATTAKLKPTNSLKPSTTTTTEQPAKGVADLLSLLDNMFADAQQIVSISSSTTTSTTSTTASPSKTTNSGSSTILRPVSSTKLMPQQPEPRIGSQGGSIESLLEETEEENFVMGVGNKVKYGGSEIATSTEPEQPPRATRQIFDYDQLPESRIKNEHNDNEEEDEDANEDEDYVEDNDNDNDDDDEQVEAETLLESGELQSVSEDETSDSEHNLLKRIDKFVDDVDDDGDDDLADLIEGLSPNVDHDHDDDDDDDDQQAREKQQHLH